MSFGGCRNSPLTFAPGFRARSFAREIAIRQPTIAPAHHPPEPTCLLHRERYTAAAAWQPLDFVPRSGRHPGTGGDPCGRPPRSKSEKTYSVSGTLGWLILSATRNAGGRDRAASPRSPSQSTPTTARH